MSKVTILRSPSGGGKTTWARKNRPLVPVCSADDFFHGPMEDPHEYRFNPAQLPEAHSACLRRFVALCETGTDVVVDNTNTTAVELAPYVALAGMYGYEVEIIRLHCDPFLAAKRNTHGVPEKAVLAMHARLMSDRLPPFWPQEQIIVVDRPIPALMAG